ncbi:MinD/ParA family ATP-binding protein [Mycobacterium spongiae]|uniref:MinD/ParA family protein n=1 Tax=Mycobacterium spongiae TaxID=886343 RepID=A0A975K131_9MYCO|nr:MinD/ParA family protein [Mycobacterium spongiae]QUR69421.1 MinD/ParA family protein [Mycobacterium spongiae]
MNQRDEFLRDRMRPAQLEPPDARPPDPQSGIPPTVAHQPGPPPKPPTPPPPPATAFAPRPTPAPEPPHPPHPSYPPGPPRPPEAPPAPPPGVLETSSPPLPRVPEAPSAPPPPVPEAPSAPPPPVPETPPGETPLEAPSPRSTDAAITPARKGAHSGERGWRPIVQALTFGLINPRPSSAQRQRAQFEATIRTALHGIHKVGVLGKGGVGKTSVAASIGSILAQLRLQDRVVAIDADTAFGRLSSRIDPRATGSFWELIADKNAQSFADLTARMGRNSAGLYALAGEPASGPRRVLDPAIYRESALRLDRHFAISIIDCGSAMDTAVTQEVLRDVDALIVVSSPWADGASAAAKTMEWLTDHDHTELLQRSIVVLNDSDGHADKRTKSLLAREFADQGQPVIEVPFDPHLRPGGVIDVVHEMDTATRGKLMQIAATIIGYFESRPASVRDQPNR